MNHVKQRCYRDCCAELFLAHFSSFTILPVLHFKLTAMIKLQVIGNLGKDCVVNNVNGKTVINFSVAHTEKFKDAQGVQKDKTIWVDCAWWTERTGIAPYLKKGTQVYAEGQPEIRTYQTQDGKQGASLTVRVQNVQLLGARPEGGNTGASYGGGQSYNQQPSYQPQAATPSAAEITEPLDDLPF
jgi:single-strand DNA-binding protein